MPVIRLLVVGGVSIVLSVVVSVVLVKPIVNAMMTMGQMMTELAGNPPVNSADTDLAVLPFAAFGLALAAVSHHLTRTASPPAAVEVESPQVCERHVGVARPLV